MSYRHGLTGPMCAHLEFVQHMPPLLSLESLSCFLLHAGGSRLQQSKPTAVTAEVWQSQGHNGSSTVRPLPVPSGLWKQLLNRLADVINKAVNKYAVGR